jgi:hypothetical protein
MNRTILLLSGISLVCVLALSSLADERTPIAHSQLWNKTSLFSHPHDWLGKQRIIFQRPAGWEISGGETEVPDCTPDWWKRHWDNCGITWHFRKKQPDGRAVDFDFDIGIEAKTHSDYRELWGAGTSVTSAGGLKGYTHIRSDEVTLEQNWTIFRIPTKLYDGKNNGGFYLICSANYQRGFRTNVERAVNAMIHSAKLEPTARIPLP